MSKRAPVPLWVAACLALGVSGPAPGPLPTPAPAGRPTPLERQIRELMRAGDVPGMQIAIVGGQSDFAMAFGVRDAATGSPVTDDTIFEAASLSKPVFAYAVLRLVDAGTLDL